MSHGAGRELRHLAVVLVARMEEGRLVDLAAPPLAHHLLTASLGGLLGSWLAWLPAGTWLAVSELNRLLPTTLELARDGLRLRGLWWSIRVPFSELADLRAERGALALALTTGEELSFRAQSSRRGDVADAKVLGAHLSRARARPPSSGPSSWTSSSTVRRASSSPPGCAGFGRSGRAPP
jgi:hypothetical protein